MCSVTSQLLRATSSPCSSRGRNTAKMRTSSFPSPSGAASGPWLIRRSGLGESNVPYWALQSVCFLLIPSSKSPLHSTHERFHSFSSIQAGNWSATTSAGRRLWIGYSMQGLGWKALTADSDHPHPEAGGAARETPLLILFAVLHPGLQGGSKTLSCA